MILRLLGWRGIAGVALALSLTVLLIIQKTETRHWKKQSAEFERLYQDEHSAFTTTVANYRQAAEAARAADQANIQRAAAEQRAVSQRTANDYETRIAAARAESQRLRPGTQTAADPGARGDAPMPALPPTPGRAPQAPGEDRLPAPPREVATSRGPVGIDDALTATEQAIQLDELIKWVRAQAAVDNNSQH